MVVGGPVEGHEEEANAIRSLAETLVPQPYLRFVGTRSDLPAIYAASDVVVHCPTYPDPYPTVVLLAMLMGKPLIGSNMGGIPEQVEDDVTGMLVPPDDPAALADAILKIMMDPAKGRALGSAAMKRVREEFAPEKQARMLMKAYETLLDCCQENLSDSKS
jgi:glycosyltransferase involved in cell wall biosynthesis